MAKMTNITVLKYGEKYSSTYVNNFFKRFKEKTTVECNFWVQTENPIGLDSYIKILPIETVDPVNRRWHKIDLFETDLLEGDCFHFDLDMVIEKNIDHYINYKSDKVVLLYANYKNWKEVAYWNSFHKVDKKRNPRDGMYNSSIFYWNTKYRSHKLLLEKHYSLKEDVYWGSFCRFSFWEGKDIVATFPFRDYNNVLIKGYSPVATINLYNQMFDTVKKVYDPLL